MNASYEYLIDQAISINRNSLSIGKHVISFRNNIESIIILKSSVVVLLKFSNDTDTKNILCVDFCCNILWEIEDIKKAFPKLNHDPYVGITIKNNMLVAYQFYGQSYIVDSSSGKIIDKFKSPERF